MKEYEVKGLMELKQGYEARLAKLPGHMELSKEFHDVALTVVRDAVSSAGLEIDIGRLRPVEGGADECGFCTVCITACTACVAYLGR